MVENPKVYISGSYQERERLQDYARALVSRGIISVARWLDGRGENLSRDAQAQMDLEDIRECDILVHFAPENVGAKYTTGGRHVELGYAIAFGKAVIHVGESENVFHDLSIEVVKAGVWYDAPSLASLINGTWTVAQNGWKSRAAYRAVYTLAGQRAAQEPAPAATAAPVTGQHWATSHGIVNIAQAQCAECAVLTTHPQPSPQDAMYASLGRQFAGLLSAAQMIAGE
jgi:hypothetical protein